VLAIDQELNHETGPLSDIQFVGDTATLVDAKEKLPSDWSWKQAYTYELQINHKPMKVLLVPYSEAGQNGAELVVWIDSPDTVSK
jgi:hypothetical protein